MALAACAMYFPTPIEFINTEKLYFITVQNGLISLKSLQQSNVCGSSYTSGDSWHRHHAQLYLHIGPVQGLVIKKSRLIRHHPMLILAFKPEESCSIVTFTDGMLMSPHYNDTDLRSSN